MCRVHHNPMNKHDGRASEGVNRRITVNEIQFTLVCNRWGFTARTKPKSPQKLTIYRRQLRFLGFTSFTIYLWERQVTTFSTQIPCRRLKLRNCVLSCEHTNKLTAGNFFRTSSDAQYGDKYGSRGTVKHSSADGLRCIRLSSVDIFKELSLLVTLQIKFTF